MSDLPDFDEHKTRNNSENKRPDNCDCAIEETK
jgi:hypothetical protein